MKANTWRSGDHLSMIRQWCMMRDIGLKFPNFNHRNIKKEGWSTDHPSFFSYVRNCVSKLHPDTEHDGIDKPVAVITIGGIGPLILQVDKHLVVEAFHASKS